MAENTIKKLEDQLKCVICLDTYTDPKLLQCFHIYCRQCLVKLVVRDQQEQLILTCPSCRQVTPVPANGVTGLKSAFQVTPLLEILEDHKKDKNAAVSEEGVKSDVTHPIPSKKKTIINCFEHTDKERQLYCETCGDLICLECVTKWGKHQNHDYHALNKAFEMYKGEITPSLEPLERKLVAVKKALVQLDICCTDVADQQAAIEANIHGTIGRLHEVLEVRRTELIGQLHQMVQRKLKSLAVQKDEMDTIMTQLSSCLDFTKESLKTSNYEEVLMMKTNIVAQVKELTTPFPQDKLVPNTEADLKFLASLDITNECQNYGHIYSSESPDPSKCEATGKGLEVAIVGQDSDIIMEAIDFKGKPCVKPIKSLQCELSSGDKLMCSIERMEQGRYKISYQPSIRGRHQIHIRVEDQHIRGSPFNIMVKLPREKLGTPIQTIDTVDMPRGVVVNKKGEVMITKDGKDIVSVFRPDGEKLRLFGSSGSGQGQFSSPWGIAIDSAGHIFVADRNNHRIQKFTENGQFISAVGTQGRESLQFNEPREITFNDSNKKLYVADCFNNCVQILNSDLTFFSKFGKKGNGKGQLDIPIGIACDSAGKVYVAEFNNQRIQIFTAEGQFLQVFWKYGHGRGELVDPYGLTIDTGDVVYVSEDDCVSIFTSEGHFLTWFGGRGKCPGKFNLPCGLAMV